MKSSITRPLQVGVRPQQVPAADIESGAGLVNVLNALFSGQEIRVSGHDYIFARRGQRLDSVQCLYTGIYVKTVVNPKYVYVTVQLGVFLDFIERELENCQVQLSPSL